MSKDLLKKNDDEKVASKEVNLEKVVKEKKLNCKVNEKGLLVKRTQLAE